MRGAAAAVLVLTLAVAGCGGADGDDSAPATESPAVTRSAPTAATAAPENEAPSGEEAEKGRATMKTAQPATPQPPSKPVLRATKTATASKTAPRPGTERRRKRSPLTGARRPAASPYELPATVTCLRRRGADVGTVSGADATIRSLRDLAQRTSRSITLRGETAWLAVGKSIADAQLLTELLALPGQPYAVARHGNAVVVRRTGQLATSRAAVACLRP